MRGGGNVRLELNNDGGMVGEGRGDDNFLFFSRAVMTAFNTLIAFCAGGGGWGDGNFLSLLVW